MRLGPPVLGLVFDCGAFQLGKAAGLVLYLLAISGGANLRIYSALPNYSGFDCTTTPPLPGAKLHFTVQHDTWPPETPPSTLAPDTDFNLLKTSNIMGDASSLYSSGTTNINPKSLESYNSEDNGTIAPSSNRKCEILEWLPSLEQQWSQQDKRHQDIHQ